MIDLRSVLGACATKAFGDARRALSSENREWWYECASAWKEMMDFRRAARDPVSGKLPETQRANWKSKHRAFKKARKAAIQEAELDFMRKKLVAARTNPRGLWTWLRGGSPPPCGISNIDVFTDHFCKVLNSAGEGARGFRAEENTLINYILWCDEVVLGLDHVGEGCWAREDCESSWQETDRPCHAAPCEGGVSQRGFHGTRKCGGAESNAEQYVCRPGRYPGRVL